MSSVVKSFQITMELYETDKHILEKFIETCNIEDIFSEEYLILYNFADDLRYSKQIQSGLAKCLLPFYLKAASQAVLDRNKIAADIYCEFNSALFFNQKSFIDAIGEKDYKYIMEYYITLTIKKMETEYKCINGWVSLFNTTAALCDNNIKLLFKSIFNGSLKVKYSFFKFLSVLLFKESDNLLAADGEKPFWTSSVWDFDSGCTDDFFWNNSIISFFDREINRGQAEFLFKDVKPLVYDILGQELTGLFIQEINQSFDNGIFDERKKEYLKKISYISVKQYWDK